VKPDVAQRPENDREISSTLGREQAGDVLNDDPSAWANKLICDSSELEEEPGARAVEAGAASGNREVLAGEASAQEVDGPSRGIRSLIGFAASIGTSSSSIVGSS
jgi:hypothetical protein